MIWIALYSATLTVFLALDVPWLRRVMQPMFEARVGHLLRPDPRLDVAGLFYAFYVVGIVWFAGMPGLKAGSPGLAALNGGILGLMCFATYEFTNMATLRGWSWTLVAADIAWGALLTAVSAALGVAIVRALAPGGV
jgi:uncharacterized membrane protein